MSLLSVRGLSVSFGQQTVLKDLTFEVKAGEWWLLLGPNGAGKSSLLKALAGSLPARGDIHLMGLSFASLRPRERAQRVAMLSQQHEQPFDLTVQDLVSLGRYPWRRGLGQPDTRGPAVVAQALLDCDLAHLAQRRLSTLSGGELQRAFLAQAFAQEPSVLLLDEPNNHMDLGKQQQLKALITAWLAQGERAVVMAMHDLAVAPTWGDHALLLSDGRAVLSGDSQSVLKSPQLSLVYGLSVPLFMQDCLGAWAEDNNAL